MKLRTLSFLVPALATAFSASAASYSIIGDRYLRKYTADTATPIYNASVDAALIAEDLCKVPWVHSDVTQAVYTTHSDSLLDSNIANRENFDAASFCARHTNSTHWAYANAACYRYELPDGTLPKLTNLSVRVFSDPYQRYGARIVLMTNSTGDIPTDCATVRGNVTGAIRATNVANRIARSINGEIKWYPAYSNVVFSADQLGASGLQLQKYLFVFVLKENYSYVNGNWLEGSSYIRNKIEIETDAAIPGWTDGATVDLARVDAVSRRVDEDEDASSINDPEADTADVTLATQSPWYGKMVCYEDDMTVVKCVVGTATNYFAAPPVAYRRMHRGSTNMTAVTHTAFRYGSSFALGPSTNIVGASGQTILSVYPHQSVKILHRAAYESRGYEYLPTLVTMTNSDVRLISAYATAYGLGTNYFATVTNLASTTRIPLGWILYTGATSAADTDHDGLVLLQEWDNGIIPTDPNASDTDGDTISDKFGYFYHLKGDDASQDFDGDGLSNYAEYLITEVFQFAKCDPDQYATVDLSGDTVCDYYKKVGELYLGEMFTDHDRVADAWERQYATAANANVCDPARDDDDDGWSNYAEAQANTDPTTSGTVDYDGVLLPQYPVPVIQANIVNNGHQLLLDNLYIKAFNEARDPEMTSSADGIWKLTALTGNSDSSSEDESGTQTTASETEYAKMLGVKPTRARTYHLGIGTLTEGEFKLYFKNKNYVEGKIIGGVFTPTGKGATSSADWYEGAYDNNGKIYSFYGDEEVGTIDYSAGLVTIDFAAEALSGTLIGSSGNNISSSGSSATTNATGSCVRFDLETAHVQLVWQSSVGQMNLGGTYYLTDALTPTETLPSLGHVREGKTSFIAYVGDANGNYVAGNPFGVVRGVDVGWAGAKFSVELSDMTSITPRFSLWNSTTSDRGTTVDESIKMLLSDRTKKQDEYEAALAGADTKIEETIYDMVEGADAVNDKVHVRIVRFGMNDMFAYLLGVGFGDVNPHLIVVDRTFNKNGRAFLCEADFLKDDEFDLDWKYLKDDIIDNEGVQMGVDDVTNVTYLAVLDGGEGHEYWIRGSYDSNTLIRASQTTIERRFETVAGHAKNKPVPQNVNGICYGARPTFQWTLPNEEAWAKKYGTSYTAFQLEVYEGATKVYESGVRRAPAQDVNGVFSWTADLSVGDLTKLGKVFLATGNYTWRVAMYNAKFKPGTDDVWSAKLAFSTAVNSQQEINAFGCSSIDVSVKYAGSPYVIDEYDDLTILTGKIRVQAFASGDFVGDPLSEAVVTEDVDALNDPSANVTLKGLPATGTYYIRSYIDSNGNHTLDDWESWGAATEPVVLKTSLVKVPVIGVWIEDCDTDGDWYPDALEYVYWGGLTTRGADFKGENATIFSEASYNKATNNLASVSKTLDGATLVFFEKGVRAKLLLDWGDSTSDITLDDIRAAVSEELTVQSETFKITSMTFNADDKTLTLKTDAEVSAGSIGSELLSKSYDFGSSEAVRVRLLKKDSIVSETWAQYGNDLTATHTTNDTYTVSTGTLPSGIYRAVIVE